MAYVWMQFPRHHSYFRKDFKMLIAVNRYAIYIVSTLCAMPHIATEMQKRQKGEKILTTKIDYPNDPKFSDR